MSILNREVTTTRLPETESGAVPTYKFNPRSLGRFYTAGAVLGSLAGAIGVNVGIWVFRSEGINLGTVPINTFVGLLGGSALGFGSSYVLAYACEKIAARVKS